MCPSFKQEAVQIEQLSNLSSFHSLVSQQHDAATIMLVLKLPQLFATFIGIVNYTLT